MSELIERTEAQRVHALRHVFVPSQQLTKQIEAFTGTEERARFLFYSTHEVYVDRLTNIRGGYTQEDDYTRAVIEHHRRVGSFIIGAAAVRSLPSRHGLGEDDTVTNHRIALQPVDMDRFQSAIESLDIYGSLYPPKTALKKPYLYMDVERRVDQDQEAAEAARLLSEQIRTLVHKRLFSVAIEGIRANETVIRATGEVPKTD